MVASIMVVHTNHIASKSMCSSSTATRPPCVADAPTRDDYRTPLRKISEHEMRISPTHVFDAVSWASSVAIVDATTPIPDTVTIISACPSSTTVALSNAVIHIVVTVTVFVIGQVIKRLIAVGGLVLREVVAVQQLPAGLLLKKNLSTGSVGAHYASDKATKAPRGRGLL